MTSSEVVSEKRNEEGGRWASVAPIEPARGWSWCTLGLPAAADTQGSGD